MTSATKILASNVLGTKPGASNEGAKQDEIKAPCGQHRRKSSLLPAVSPVPMPHLN